jgi:hypothetical protein
MSTLSNRPACEPYCSSIPFPGEICVPDVTLSLCKPRIFMGCGVDQDKPVVSDSDCQIRMPVLGSEMLSSPKMVKTVWCLLE